MRLPPRILLLLPLVTLAACQSLTGPGSCEPPATSAASGEMVVDLYMPNQDLVVDDVGDHAEAEELAVRLTEPRLVMEGGEEVEPAEFRDRPLSLGDACQERRQFWARWENVDGSPSSLRFQFTPRADAYEGVKKLLPGASVALAANFQAVLADSAQRYGAVIVNLPMEQGVSIGLPEGGETENDAGRTWRLVIDPQRWLVGDEGRLIPLGTLSGDAIADGDAETTQRVMSAIAETITIESD